MTNFPVGDVLPDSVLGRRDRLPQKPAAVTLTGRYVRLEPTDIDRDADPLFRVSNGDALTIGSRSTEAYDAEKMI